MKKVNKIEPVIFEYQGDIYTGTLESEDMCITNIIPPNKDIEGTSYYFGELTFLPITKETLKKVLDNKVTLTKKAIISLINYVALLN